MYYFVLRVIAFNQHMIPSYPVSELYIAQFMFSFILVIVSGLFEGKCIWIFFNCLLISLLPFRDPVIKKEWLEYH